MELDKIMDVSKISTGKRLRLKRILDGKKQDELSNELGIPQPTLSKYETEDMEIQEKHHKAIYDYLTK